MVKAKEEIGIVLIGRNEGERLWKCLHSIQNLGGYAVVYVDSGSTDGSVPLARSFGADVVELSTEVRFTAARARNAGYERLRQCWSNLRYVQFLDGDCDLVSGWIETSADFLKSHPDVAVVCGRRRERHPDRSVYNMLCDIEWNTPIGRSMACGGDALMRAAAFDQVGGYRPDVIAGEEPELCSRLRAAGWKVWRIDQEMSIHDAAIIHFSQWWRRANRTGYGYAQLATVTKHSSDRLYSRECWRARIWGIIIPVACVGVTLIWPWGATAWFVYPVQLLRQISRTQGSLKTRATTSILQLVSRFAEARGQIQFYYDEFARVNLRKFDYKSSGIEPSV